MWLSRVSGVTKSNPSPPTHPAPPGSPLEPRSPSQESQNPRSCTRALGELADGMRGGELGAWGRHRKGGEERFPALGAAAAGSEQLNALV